MKKEMTKAELLAKATPLKSEEFSDIYIIDSEKEYDGFWGENGFNNIIVLGKMKGKEGIELITDHSDVINAMRVGTFNLDINSANGVVHIWFDKPVKLSVPVNSACMFYGRE